MSTATAQLEDRSISRASDTGWIPVCRLSQILPDCAVAALVDGHQVAVFRLGDDRLFAIDNLDPCSGANVLSRGIVGDADGEPFVASPVHKERFALETGRGLDGQQDVSCHRVRLSGDQVEVAAPRSG